MKKKMKIIIPVILLLFLVSDIGASFYFYDLAVARTSKEFLYNSSDLEQSDSDTVPAVNPSVTWFNSEPFKDVIIESDDGLQLHGFYLEAKKPTRNTAIVVHGYSSRAQDMASYAQFYHETLGYNVLMPDNRGHGQSEGDYIGFGWLDRKDYLKWIDYILTNVADDANIVMHGVSMGGATVLMTSGENLPTNVKAIISDCAYTSVKDELSYQIKRMYHLPSFPIINTTSLLTKIRAGYFFGEASAVKQVAKSKTPILFIHGDADTFVPYEMVHELFDNCNSEKDIFIVPGAVHGTAYRDDKEGYESKVNEFINKYINN